MNRGSGKGQHLKQAWHDWFDICTSKIPLARAGKFTLAMHFVLEGFDLQLLWFPGDQCKRACESSCLWERSVNKSHFLWDGPVTGDYREVIGVEGDAWGAIPAWGSPTVLSDPRSPSKPRLKLSVAHTVGDILMDMWYEPAHLASSKILFWILLPFTVLSGWLSAR